MNRNPDIVIIGGGVSGCSIAWHLAQRGIRNVTVVEKDFLASGSTGRCGAGVRMQWGTEMNCRLAMHSIGFFEHAQEELGYGRDIEFKQRGYLIVASTPKEERQFRKNVALQNSLGIPSRCVSPEEAKRIVPLLDESRINMATFCEKDGHLNPFHVTQAFAEAAVREGAEILKHTTVRGIVIEHGRIAGVETSEGFLSTRIVVNAAGGYADAVGRMAGIEIPVSPERHQILVTEPVDPIQGPMVMSFSLNIYCQQTPHGSFIMGRGDPEESTGYGIASDWRFLEEMAASCCRLLPPLRKLRVLRQWSGLYENTPDRQPIYGPVPQVSGLYLACGFSGHGFMLSPVTGLLVSRMIAGEETGFPVEKLGIERFERGELIREPSVV